MIYYLSSGMLNAAPDYTAWWLRQRGVRS